jgi:hypothetical protein
MFIHYRLKIGFYQDKYGPKLGHINELPGVKRRYTGLPAAIFPRPYAERGRIIRLVPAQPPLKLKKTLIAQLEDAFQVFLVLVQGWDKMYLIQRVVCFKAKMRRHEQGSEKGIFRAFRQLRVPANGRLPKRFKVGKIDARPFPHNLSRGRLFPDCQVERTIFPIALVLRYAVNGKTGFVRHLRDGLDCFFVHDGPPVINLT